MRKRRLESKSRVIARNFLDGTKSPADACCELFLYTVWLPDRFTEEDKKFINAVNSEVDALPIGKLKELWHPDFIGEKLKALAAYDEQIRSDVKALCERYLAGYKTESIEARES